MLSICAPVVYKNPNPPPIVFSALSPCYSYYSLQLQCRCNQESYLWICCTGSNAELDETQIKALCQKHFLLADLPCPVTVPLSEAAYTTLFLHVVCEGLRGGSSVAHSEIPFPAPQEARSLSSPHTETPTPNPASVTPSMIAPITPNTPITPNIPITPGAPIAPNTPTAGGGGVEA